MRQKQLEVGASRSVSPASSTSTNVSPLNSKVADLTNRSSSSSEPGSFHFPSLSVSERPAQLSPLTECAENGESSSCLLHRAAANGLSKYHETPSTTMAEEPNSLSPNPSSSLSRSAMCDGQQQQRQQQLSGSGGSSPSIGVCATDFMGTEFYMDESLPSSLSEHPVDGQHQAIVSLLQVLDDLQLANRPCSRSRKRSTTANTYPLPTSLLPLPTTFVYGIYILVCLYTLFSVSLFRLVCCTRVLFVPCVCVYHLQRHLLVSATHPRTLLRTPVTRRLAYSNFHVHLIESSSFSVISRYFRCRCLYIRCPVSC